jgi:hypothetical protein
MFLLSLPWKDLNNPFTPQGRLIRLWIVLFSTINLRQLLMALLEFLSLFIRPF